ncbi:hypothetical protein B0T24DRAFT_697324 [Lasiosphaeria ovina]|uniref:Uncharacterized protein n=1 Tax=Lasiosphaeria ovina TaxID=92902 RepID=A0AAE0NFU9_9PEZI|nr:hypothetical protein B0T24DRAFT_697324 [Lasiosphaeria ovina]
MSLSPSPKPSAIMGVSAVAARLPIADIRHVLASMLTESEARNLVASLATSKPRGRPAAFINTRYDDMFAPQPDQLVGFDALAVRSSDGNTETQESLMLLQQTLANSTATGTGATPNKSTALVPGRTKIKSNTRRPTTTVTANLRAIQAAAVPPAGFGTRLNALRALLSVNSFLITRALLFTDAQRDIVEAALSGIVNAGMRAVCGVMTTPESIMALRTSVLEDPSSSSSQAARCTIEQELVGQTNVFKRHGMFEGVVEGYEMLVEGRRRAGAAVQALPVVIEIEDDEEEEEEGEIPDSTDA